MNNDFENKNPLENREAGETAPQPESTENIEKNEEPAIKEPVLQEAQTEEKEEKQEPVLNEQTQSETTESQQEPTWQNPNNDGQTPPQNNFYGEQKHYVPNGFQNFNTQQNNVYHPPIKNKDPKNGKKGLRIFAIVLIAVVLFTVGIGVGKLSGLTNTSSSSKTEKSDDSLIYKGEDIDVNSGNPITRDDIKPDENGKYTADQVAQLVGESVVNIQVYSTTDSSVGATASGVILNKKGYIITNDHIYSEVTNAKFIVTTSDGNSYKASYVAGDQRSDIGVLKFDEVPENIVPATFANSSEIKAGDDVIAIGSPYGLSGTVTKGIISYPSRRISNSTKSEDGTTTASYSMRVIQTDVALNSGNSGGALVNMYGQVIGINSSKIAIEGYEGLCFAIPSNDAVKYAKSLVKNGVVSGRAKLGITYTPISSASALLNDVPSGLRIQEIDSKSDLYSKGLSTGNNGDIITEINGKKITTSDVALDIIDDSSAGDEVELKVYIVSTKKTKTFKVKLLEDTSNTSYKNEIPLPTTTAPANGYGGNNGGNGSNGSNGNNGGYYYYQIPSGYGR